MQLWRSDTCFLHNILGLTHRNKGCTYSDNTLQKYCCCSKYLCNSLHSGLKGLTVLILTKKAVPPTFHLLYSLPLAPKDSLPAEEANRPMKSENPPRTNATEQQMRQGAEDAPRSRGPVSKVHRRCRSGGDRGSVCCVPTR